MVKRTVPEAVFLVGSVLKILSFRLGTLLLCGFICFDLRWPFLHKFSEMSLDKREKVLQKWSKERRLVPLRMMFVLTKLFCFYDFYSRVIRLFHCRTGIHLFPNSTRTMLQCSPAADVHSIVVSKTLAYHLLYFCRKA